MNFINNKVVAFIESKIRNKRTYLGAFKDELDASNAYQDKLKSTNFNLKIIVI